MIFLMFHQKFSAVAWKGTKDFDVEAEIQSKTESPPREILNVNESRNDDPTPNAKLIDSLTACDDLRLRLPVLGPGGLGAVDLDARDVLFLQHRHRMDLVRQLTHRFPGLTLD